MSRCEEPSDSDAVFDAVVVFIKNPNGTTVISRQPIKHRPESRAFVEDSYEDSYSYSYSNMSITSIERHTNRRKMRHLGGHLGGHLEGYQFKDTRKF